MRPRPIQLAGATRLRTIQGQHFALHDVGFGPGDISESCRRNSKCLREHGAVIAAHPVTDTERAVLRIEPVVERQNRVTRRRAEGLDGVAVTPGESPEIAGTKIDDLRQAVGVDHGHLAMALDDVGPLGRIVPVHLTGAAWIQEQMRAGDIGGNRESARSDLTRPAAGSGLDRPLVEGSRKNDGVAGLSRNRLQIV